MVELILNKVIPVNLIFFLGYFLKKTGALKEEDGRVLFVFNSIIICLSLTLVSL